jgi:hypothetical protein
MESEQAASPGNYEGCFKIKSVALSTWIKSRVAHRLDSRSLPDGGEVGLHCNKDARLTTQISDLASRS